MIFLIKSSPGTTEGKRAIKLARDMAADIVLVQNGVYYAFKEKLEGYCGTVYTLDEDLRRRGLKDDEIERGIKKINWEELIDRMAKEDKVLGMF